MIPVFWKKKWGYGTSFSHILIHGRFRPQEQTDPDLSLIHILYSKSDPRAELFKRFVKQLSEEKGRVEDFELYSMIEELGPKVITEERKIYKGVSANVDFYSGFVYSMLDIPEEMFTPIFAIARIVGWSAHRIEELINMDKIIRPAYTSVMQEEVYKPLSERWAEDSMPWHRVRFFV